jgi:hypothetical protein
MATSRYTAAIGDFIDGEFHCKAISGEHIIIELGPAQVISIKRGLDRYVASYEATEKKAS